MYPRQQYHSAHSSSNLIAGFVYNSDPACSARAIMTKPGNLINMPLLSLQQLLNSQSLGHPSAGIKALSASALVSQHSILARFQILLSCASSIFPPRGMVMHASSPQRSRTGRGKAYNLKCCRYKIIHPKLKLPFDAESPCHCCIHRLNEFLYGCVAGLS